MIHVTGIHHLALVTASLDRTIRYWRDLLGLEMRARLGAPGYRQYFFAAGGRTLIAFFEWTGAEPVPEKDHGAPVRGPIVFDHVALELEGMEDLFELRDRLASAGFWVSEAMDQGFVRSIYSFDPNGVPVEFSVTVPGADFRQVPLFADRQPGDVAAAGAAPQPGVWPEPAPAARRAERVIYPGAGREYFHGVKKQIQLDNREGSAMGYTIVGLKEKILEMYPELERHGIAANLVFDPEKDAYVLKLHKGSAELTTHLERRDADDCMNGIKCVTLGIQVAQFVGNFALRERS